MKTNCDICTKEYDFDDLKFGSHGGVTCLICDNCSGVNVTATVEQVEAIAEKCCKTQQA